jgi:hypothetical protein
LRFKAQHVSGIIRPSSGGTTRTQIWLLLSARVDVGWSWDVVAFPKPETSPHLQPHTTLTKSVFV